MTVYKGDLLFPNIIRKEQKVKKVRQRWFLGNLQIETTVTK